MIVLDIILFLVVLFFLPKMFLLYYYVRKSEDWEDIDAAREALARGKKEGFVSWEEVKAGLEDPTFVSE